jgi:O-acetyl-ADP-ribose deacetylase (regulator of RNase III)
LPAFSSGIFDFPKRLCAKEMFDAIEEFAEDRADFSTKCDYLVRVEIIIIDELTYGIFKDEFDLRYVKKLATKDKCYYLFDSHYPKPSSFETTYR